ncbi:hypothetical protein DPMN_183907 [Dreissena polymorpha]|uniref:Uncharacterized protein n=1 Tax=Dreissena polymorpha TaxID=45954 RepID=A0A9D4I5Y4_DREPO|nr:hypothetical protein DPMN_183907 [Dreissena polymorpha]
MEKHQTVTEVRYFVTPSTIHGNSVCHLATRTYPKIIRRNELKFKTGTKEPRNADHNPSFDSYPLSAHVMAGHQTDSSRYDPPP